MFYENKQRINNQDFIAANKALQERLTWVKKKKCVINVAEDIILIKMNQRLQNMLHSPEIVFRQKSFHCWYCFPNDITTLNYFFDKNLLLASFAAFLNHTKKIVICERR